jgi:hypothetical protein
MLENLEPSWTTFTCTGTAGEALPGLGASMARAVRAAGLPVAASEGIRLAVDPGAEPGSVPLRSVIAGPVANPAARRVIPQVTSS